ncbi:MAG: secretin and TonB N-terminal domain-containing protein [bacterium]|nr:secretin and TonB N-terminal domain-containing protein [bacterium]
MVQSNIKKALAATLLLAFSVPSTFAYSNSGMSYDYGNVDSSVMTLSGGVDLTDKNDLITLSLRDSDVKQVLRMFADKAGLNIVFHNSVTGKVTLDLVQTPINNAFNLVLNVAGLNYYKQGNTMIVMSKDAPDNAMYSKQEMMVFPVNYVGAEKIATFLNKNVFSMKRPGMSSVDAATVNSATNELIVFGMPSDAAIVRKIIQQFDREPYSRTFAVNHTTPAEMATMICDLLLPSRGIVSGKSSSGGGIVAPQYQSIAPMGVEGSPTGGASSTESSSSSSSSEELKLGEGIVACSVTASTDSSNVAPFDVQNLSIAYFPQRGTITLMGGSEAQARMIEKFIKANDIKQPQAYLEVQIVELNEEGSREFQNNWSISSKAWNFAFNGGSVSGGRQGGPFGNYLDAVDIHFQPGYFNENSLDGTRTWVPAQYNETPFKMLTPATTYISWTMNYLIENRKGRVLANPKILITNGQESVIDLTQDYVEKVTAEYLTSSYSGGVSTGAVQRDYTIGDDLGIKVNLVPFISPEGYVTLNIKPEYSTIAGQVYARGETGSNDLVATLLSRRDLDLKNVRIKDGETLIIGGLIQETESKTVNKIPLLGDLPLIGAAFRSTSSSKSKSELVIMITPRIINDGGDGSLADNI